MTNESLAIDSILDLTEAMTNMDGDVELLQEIVEIFMETSESQLTNIRQCIYNDEVKLVGIQAHGLKGGASNFCAPKFVASALRLELLAKSDSLDGAEAMLDQMCADYSDIVEVVKVINWKEVERNWKG